VVHLVISAGSGGVWKFPIRFLATEAEVDDTITVEAVGLNKEAVVGFRLTSQSRSVPVRNSLNRENQSTMFIAYSTNILNHYLCFILGKRFLSRHLLQLIQIESSLCTVRRIYSYLKTVKAR
jgi:hypothetical protein